MAIDFSISTERLRHLLVAGVCTLIVGYFLMHGVLGDRGFLVMSQLEYKLAEQQAVLQTVQKEREKLEARTRLLKSDSLDLDLLDERARATLGYTKPNEYVIILDKKN